MGQAGDVAPLTANEKRLAAYADGLKRHDWTFEHSDCGRAYRKGREDRNVLLAEAMAIDPDWRIWNEHAPLQYQRRPSSSADSAAMAQKP